MTALQLLTYICAALLLQTATGVGVLLWRNRRGIVQMPQLGEPAPAVPPAGAWSGWRDFRVLRRVDEDMAKTQCSFYLQPVDGIRLPSFKPGQYLTFSIRSDDNKAGHAVIPKLTRCYSLSDQPEATHYRITIKRVPPPVDRPEVRAGIVSNYFHDCVKEGDVLKVKAPSGQFFIDANADVPAVFIAGGIGITPMMSMLRWCLSAQPQRKLYLYYGVRNGADQAFKEFLEATAHSHPLFELNVVYADPRTDEVLGQDYQHAGFINLALLRNSLPQGRHQFYVCGPPAMMQSVLPALRQWGVDEQYLHFESFGPSSMSRSGLVTTEPLTAPSISLDVQLSRSSRTLVWSKQDANLLDFLERHSVSVDSACRVGSCGTCETGLVSGTVDYAEKPTYAIAHGGCLLCVAVPTSSLVLDL